MVTTEGSTRSRLVPVIISFSLLIALGATQQIIQDISSNYNLLFTFSIAYAITPILVAVTVAYGVIRYRVMDINFILERTLVYSVLTAAIIFCFVVIEFFVGKIVEERVADIVQMAAAVIVGVSIQYFHLKVDRFVKVFFFRRRYAAIKKLNKAAHMIQQVTSFSNVDNMLVNEPFTILGLASVGLFRKDNKDYKRVAARGWDDHTSTLLNQADPLVIRLTTKMKTLEIKELSNQRTDFPSGIANPILIIPIMIGNKLEAILCCSGHLTGEDIDSDERKSLQNMARGAALAYVQLFQVSLQEEVEKLKMELKNLGPML